MANKVVDGLACADAGPALDRGSSLVCSQQQAPSSYAARKGGHASRAELAGRTVRQSIAEAFVCPACGNVSYLLPALWRHLGRCCPDLWAGPEEWHAAGSEPAAVRALLRAAIAREAAQRAIVVRAPASAFMHCRLCLGACGL